MFSHLHDRRSNNVYTKKKNQNIPRDRTYIEIFTFHNKLEN